MKSARVGVEGRLGFRLVEFMVFWAIRDETPCRRQSGWGRSPGNTS